MHHVHRTYSRRGGCGRVHRPHAEGVTMPEEKLCTGCQSTKPVEQFYRLSAIYSKDGRSRLCKECTKTEKKKMYERRPDILSRYKAKVAEHNLERYHSGGEFKKK